MVWYIVGATVILLATGSVATWMIRRRRGGAGLGGEPVVEVETAEAEDSADGNGDAAAIEHSKVVIHSLLQSVSDNVAALVGDNTKYSTALAQHKLSINKAMTIAGLRELERVMLDEIEEILTSNAQYREQLDKANAKLDEQQEQLEQLQSDVGLDFLTKVPNRRSFDGRLLEEIERAKRYGHSLSLMVVDVDHFKRVNDVHGHLAGDRILRAIAHLLNEQKRASDFLARFGGEEFALVLPETSAEQARVLADKTRSKVERATFRYENKPIAITISLGVGEILAQSDRPEALFARVDAALYRAKEGGRNRVEVAPLPRV